MPSYAAVNVEGRDHYAEWYWNSLNKARRLPVLGNGALTWKFHQRVYGANFPYFDFAPMFRAELYDPDHWADVFERSGAKYVALTSKHHEGFTLWRNAAGQPHLGTPLERRRYRPQARHRCSTSWRPDAAAACTWASTIRSTSGTTRSGSPTRSATWPSTCSRSSRTSSPTLKPSIIFSDGEWELTSAEWRSPELLAWLFNESPVRDEVVIDDRWGKDTRHKHGGYYTTEYTSGMQQAAHPWEESRGMGYSYGYNRMETLADYHTDRELLMMLLDIVSRGGNLLLDIGPTADGRIPVVMEERLIQIGDFLRPNGEAIYGTHARRNPAPVEQGRHPEARREGVHVGLRHHQDWWTLRPPATRASRPSTPRRTTPSTPFCRAARPGEWCWTISKPLRACASRCSKAAIHWNPRGRASNCEFASPTPCPPVSPPARPTSSSSPARV